MTTTSVNPNSRFTLKFKNDTQKETKFTNIQAENEIQTNKIWLISGLFELDIMQGTNGIEPKKLILFKNDGSWWNNDLTK